jgi:hypothetical protein
MCESRIARRVWTVMALVPARVHNGAGLRGEPYANCAMAGVRQLAMSPLIHAVVAVRAFASCMPEGFDVRKYLDPHIDLYLHAIAKP